MTPNTGWDVLKLNIKKMAIRYAIGSKKQERNLLKDLDNRLHEAKKDLDNSLDMETNVQIIRETELQIKEIKDRKQEGERIRAKQEKILYDERSTKYFFNMEKRRGQNKQITILKKDNEDKIEKQMDILEEITDFYKKLYSTNGHDEKQMQENLKHVTGRLNNDDVKTLNKNR